MRTQHTQFGITLIELMVTLAILAVIATIAVPAYQGYVATSRETEGWNNLNALKVAEEQYFLENNTYFGGTSASDISTKSGGLWKVAEASGTENFTYVFVSASATGYDVTATGTNKVKSSVIIECTMASGQSKCWKH